MDAEHLGVWVDHRGPVSVFRIRGELDASSAGRFKVASARELGEASGPVAVDLSALDFLDCAGARVLLAALATIQPCRLVDVFGLQPVVSRLLDLLGVDLGVARGPGDPVLSAHRRELMRDARVTRGRSHEMLLETSMLMARLATTYAELAAARARRADQGQEQGKAERMLALSDNARDLCERYRDRATTIAG